MVALLPGDPEFGARNIWDGDAGGTPEGVRCRRVEHRIIEAGVFLPDWLACVFTATKSGDRENSGYEHSELVPGQSVSSQNLCILEGLLSNSHAHNSLTRGPAALVDPLNPIQHEGFPHSPKGTGSSNLSVSLTPLTAPWPTQAGQESYYSSTKSAGHTQYIQKLHLFEQEPWGFPSTFLTVSEHREWILNLLPWALYLREFTLLHEPYVLPRAWSLISSTHIYHSFPSNLSDWKE